MFVRASVMFFCNRDPGYAGRKIRFAEKTGGKTAAGCFFYEKSEINY